jgi:hypothetical protein
MKKTNHPPDAMLPNGRNWNFTAKMRKGNKNLNEALLRIARLQRQLAE